MAALIPLASALARSPQDAVAWTLYLEGRGTTRAGQDDGDLPLIAAAIWADAYGKPDRLAIAALNSARFSCWRADDQQGRSQPAPGTPDADALARCRAYAAEMVRPGWTPPLSVPRSATIMYHAKRIRKPRSPAWDKARLVRVGVGHLFYVADG
jgi:hypothetical protein